MAVTYQEAREHDTFKEGRATKRRRKDGPSSKAPRASTWKNAIKVSESTAELFGGREVLRAGLTSLRASFTVSPQGECQCCVWCFVFCGFLLGRFLLLFGVTRYSLFFLSIAFDAQRRQSSKTVTIVMMSAAQEQKKSKNKQQPANTVQLTIFCREIESLARGHPRGTASSLRSLWYSGPINSSLSFIVCGVTFATLSRVAGGDAWRVGSHAATSSNPSGYNGILRLLARKRWSYPSYCTTAWYVGASTAWAHPGVVLFPPQWTHKPNVQCGLQRFPHKGFRSNWG